MPSAPTGALLSLVAIAGRAVALAAIVAGVVVGRRPRSEEARAALSVPQPGRAEPLDAGLVPGAASCRRRLAGSDEPSGRAVPRSVSDLARRLPLERKVAQLFLFGFDGRTSTPRCSGGCAGTTSAGSCSSRHNYTDSASSAQLGGEARVVARDEGHVPPLVLAASRAASSTRCPDLPPARRARRPRVRRRGRAPRRADSAARPARARRDRGARPGRRRRARGRLRARRARLLRRSRGGGRRSRTRCVRAYRERRHCSAPVEHFPGLGLAPTSRPRRAGQRRPRPAGAARARPAAVPRRDRAPARPAVVLGHALYPMNDFTAPASLSRVGGHRPAARRARLRGRGDHRRPRRAGREHARAPCPTPPCGRCGRGPTCSGSRARPATSRPPTAPCCGR